MLIHGVDVEQVVLHLTDDAAKHPQVASQHTGLVHQAKGVRLAARLAQDAHEGRAVHRIAAKLGVHQLACVVQGSQRAGRKAIDAQGLLVGQKGFQDGVGVTAIEIVVDHFEHAGALEKLRADRPHRRTLRTLNTFFDVEQQDLVELRHGFRGPVVAPHQCFRGALPGTGCMAETLGDGGLQIEDQPVLAPLRHHVQARADEPKHALVALQLLDLERRDQALGRQRMPGFAQTRCPRDPDQDLQVAQSAGAFLAVGFQRVRRVFVLLVALLHFERLGAQKRLRVHGLRKDDAK